MAFLGKPLQEIVNKYDFNETMIWSVQDLTCSEVKQVFFHFFCHKCVLFFFFTYHEFLAFFNFRIKYKAFKLSLVGEKDISG